MSSCQLMFPGLRSFLVSQVLDLNLLPLAFSLILTITSRLLHPYITDDKTTRLTVRQFSTVRDTQRGSQSYTKRRGEGVKGDLNEMRWNQKRREQASQ